MIKVFQNTKIYVVAPAKAATGGPELLHQIVYHLRGNLNLDAYMYYKPNNVEDPIHEAYKKYNNPYVRNIEDLEENILIVPEVMNGVNELCKYRHIRKVLWWLSVDNFYLTYILGFKKNYFIERTINKISAKFLNKSIFDVPELVLKNIKYFKIPIEIQDTIKSAGLHLVQSYYAKNHLKTKMGIPEDKKAYLSDYLNPDFLKIKTDLSKKENIVAYNPKKGFSFTKKIISNAKDIKFVPLINMTRQQVIETLQRAKLYIDFGNHPGKDRIPREAAILGCCVITGKRGSAAFFEDVPIPDEYKFEDKEENIPKIIDKIYDCFENFEERYESFNYYRQVIQSEPQKFIDDLKEIFIKD